jgi:hypothetical protein
MVTQTEVKTNTQSDITERPALIELTPEQLDDVSGGCLYGHGIVGPTLVLAVLVAVLIT